MLKDLFWEIKSPSSTKKMIEMEIFKFFRCFSRIYKKEERYRADKIGERVDPWSTPTFILKISDKNYSNL